MKKLFINSVVILTILLPIFACKNSNSPSKDFVKTFEGTIGKENVILKMTSNNGEVTGDYLFKNSKQKLSFKGKLLNEILQFEEFDLTGNMTGKFEGRFSNISKIEGNWSKPNKDSLKSVVLIESNGSINHFESLISEKNEKKDSTTKITDNTWIRDINGYYEYKSDIIHQKTGLKFNAILRLVYHKEDKTVQIHVEDVRCGIELRGYGKIIGYRQIEYKDDTDGCKIRITFHTSDVVSIKSEKCTGRSGTMCIHYWDNTYIKDGVLDFIDEGEDD